MPCSSASSRTWRRAAPLLCVFLAAVACKKAKPRKHADTPPTSVWARTTTDDRVLQWRSRCGTEAKAQRIGPNINLAFKSGDGISQLGCTLEYRESNRDLLSVAIIVTSADPKATVYGQWAKLEAETRALVDELLTAPARSRLWAALGAKAAGNFSLGDGFTAQVIQGNGDGILTVVLNVHVGSRP